MSEQQSDVHAGGCLCGAVRYRTEGEPIIVARCHCVDCQRSSGAGHSTGAMFPVERFTLTGEVGEYKLRSLKGNEVTKSFCPVCGSQVFGRNSGMPGFVTITLGTLDESSTFTPQVVVFARNRKPWDARDETLPTFETQPDWTPGA